jgi:hypothetical protein
MESMTGLNWLKNKMLCVWKFLCNQPAECSNANELASVWASLNREPRRAFVLDIFAFSNSVPRARGEITAMEADTKGVVKT